MMRTASNAASDASSSIPSLSCLSPDSEAEMQSITDWR